MELGVFVLHSLALSRSSSQSALSGVNTVCVKMSSGVSEKPVFEAVAIHDVGTGRRFKPPEQTGRHRTDTDMNVNLKPTVLMVSPRYMMQNPARLQDSSP